MIKSKKKQWIDLEEKYNVMEADGFKDSGEDANGVWISWYLQDLEEYIDMCVHQNIQSIIKTIKGVRKKDITISNKSPQMEIDVAYHNQNTGFNQALSKVIKKLEDL